MNVCSYTKGSLYENPIRTIDLYFFSMASQEHLPHCRCNLYMQKRSCNQWWIPDNCTCSKHIVTHICNMSKSRPGPQIWHHYLIYVTGTGWNSFSHHQTCSKVIYRKTFQNFWAHSREHSDLTLSSAWLEESVCLTNKSQPWDEGERKLSTKVEAMPFWYGHMKGGDRTPTKTLA